MDNTHSMVAQLRRLRSALARADGSTAVATARVKVDAQIARMYAAGLRIVDGVWVIA